MKSHQLNFDGETKEEEAIRFIREHEPKFGYVLGFSGGKDSIVLYDLAKKSGVKFNAYYCATGIEPTVAKFIRSDYPEIKWLRPSKSFWYLIPRKGFPTKFARWCCDRIRKEPFTRLQNNTVRLMGIRYEESPHKRGLRHNPDYNEKLKWWTVKPLFNWKEWEIWDYIDKNNLRYCSLYDEGFHRVGCVVCPFLTYRQLMLNKERWPQTFNMFEKCMKKLWDDREAKRQIENGYSHSFYEFIDNWYHGNINRKDKDENTKTSKKQMHLPIL